MVPSSHAFERHLPPGWAPHIAVHRRPSAPAWCAAPADDAFSYISSSFVLTEDSYPYTEKQGKCLAGVADRTDAVTLQRPGSSTLWGRDEIMRAVSNQSPVVVYINVAESFFSYTSGEEGWQLAACSRAPSLHACLCAGLRAGGVPCSSCQTQAALLLPAGVYPASECKGDGINHAMVSGQRECAPCIVCRLQQCTLATATFLELHRYVFVLMPAGG